MVVRVGTGHTEALDFQLSFAVNLKPALKNSLFLKTT